MMPKKLIVANWKLHPDSLEETEHLCAALAKREVPEGVRAVICPPYPYLAAAKKALHGTRYFLGAQDVFWEESGAFTGEVSVQMLKHLGVSHVIAGHSERRRYLRETDKEIAEKLMAIVNGGLEAILCVGEPAWIRNRGKAAAKRFVLRQLKDAFSLSAEKMKHLAVAYEPVWAISTASPRAKEDTPEDAAEMADHIRNFLSLKSGVTPPVLYGGSVNSKNIASFLEEGMLDGVLVGHASLDPIEFTKIVALAGG
jgi:triosephosphate isomerase